MTLPSAAIPRDSTEFGHYAGFVSRAAAFVIDLFVLLLALFGGALVVSMILSLFSFESPKWPEFSDGIFAVAFGATAFIYFFVAWWLWGKTVGKALLGLQVVGADGSKLPPLRCAVRVFGYLISAAVFFLGYWWVLISRRRRAWHDGLARSCVVYSWQARSSRIFGAVEDRLDQREG